MDEGNRRKAYAWMKRTAKGMPELAIRVFNLRGKMYMGCGFHYAMEKNLGKVIASLNDYDSRMNIARLVILEVITEGLYKDVRKAELSAIDLSNKG